MLKHIDFVASICKSVGDIAIHVTFTGPKETRAIYKFYNSPILLIPDSNYFIFIFQIFTSYSTLKLFENLLEGHG